MRVRTERVQQKDHRRDLALSYVGGDLRIPALGTGQVALDGETRGLADALRRGAGANQVPRRQHVAMPHTKVGQGVFLLVVRDQRQDVASVPMLVVCL